MTNRTKLEQDVATAIAHLAFTTGGIRHTSGDILTRKIGELVDAKIALAMAPTEVPAIPEKGIGIAPFDLSEKITIQSLKEWVDAIEKAYPDARFNTTETFDAGTYNPKLAVWLPMDMIRRAHALSVKDDPLPSYVVPMGS